MDKRIKMVLQVLENIANAYDENALDDEARKFWGVNNEHKNTTNPKDVILYAGRGGRTLLTLADCFAARDLLDDPWIKYKDSGCTCQVEDAAGYPTIVLYSQTCPINKHKKLAIEQDKAIERENDAEENSRHI